MKKIIVTYLSSKYVEAKLLSKFIYNYKRFKSGYNHKLIICFKNLTDEELKKRLKRLKNIKCEIFIDPSNKNDHEWGSLKRICEKNKNNYFFFLNDYTYPVCNNWLKMISGIIKFNRIIGCSASNSSHFSNAFYRHKNDNYFLAILKLLKYFFFFPKFPNPHIRATGFLIHAKNYLKFIQNKSIKTKFQSLLLESGKKSLTNYFIKKNYELIVVNNKGKIFYKNEWKLSETFSYKNQSGVIMSDNKIRKYSLLNKRLKLKDSHKCWGR
jgi:hypothetical protein